MLYSKAPFTLEEQANQLLQRGLLADRALLIERLKSVNYYRLSGYLFPFRDEDDSFYPGTSFECVWRRYTFDRHLRLLTMDAIERIEVSIRTALAYEHAHTCGPFGYTVPANLPNLNRDEFGRFLSNIISESNRSKEVFIRHFNQKYGDQHGWPPIWMASELMTLGTTLTFYRGADTSIRKLVAQRYRQPEEIVESWLRSLHAIRNGCAHHGRLWNRVLGVPPKIPKKNKNPDWHAPVSIDNGRVFAILTVLRYLLAIIAPQSDWPSRLKELLHSYPDIPLDEMGFPANWDDCPIWKLPKP